MFLLFTGKIIFLSCPRATFPLNLFLPLNNKVLSLPPSCCFLIIPSFHPLLHDNIYEFTVLLVCLRKIRLWESRLTGSIRNGKDRQSYWSENALTHWQKNFRKAQWHNTSPRKKMKMSWVSVIADSTMLLWNRQQNHWQMMFTFTQRICAT